MSGARHAVITGGGGGIGAAIADALAAQGMRLTLIGRDHSKLQAKAASLRQAQGIVADITQQSAVTDALRLAADRFGPVEIMINNAGAAQACPFLEIDEAEWRSAFDVNLTAAFHCAQAVLPAMIAVGWGRIVTIASTAGLVPYRNVAAYVAAKHGVIGLTRALALEFARSGVTVNAICPGYTETEMAQQAIRNLRDQAGHSEAEARRILAAKNPQGRLVQPEQVADSVVWLCGAGSDAVTGQAIAVCGGEVMA
jgi:NAD(P)-dependent dehydrogenase (short-subunit alcohol dehydrogenase family)